MHSDLIPHIAQWLTAHQRHCATAESCTGGLVGAALTAVPGSSQWFRGGIIAYANEVKHNLLGVPTELLEQSGAVSEAVVLAMAENVCQRLNVAVGLSVSGIAGPGGGSPEKPVGTVWLGLCLCGRSQARLLHLNGDRERIRQAAVEASLLFIWDTIQANEARA